MRPQIGIVTMIGHDHYKAFRTLEETAEEKGKLIEVLPLAGTAILNADDSYVREMASRTSARVITFGLSPEAHVRASEISSAWPQRLALTVTYAERSVRVRTRLVGSHWVPSVLAAVACGVSAGFGLDLCARAVETVNPVFRRYSVHPVPGGPVFVLDCAKAPLWTIPSSLAFVRDAQAPRKTFILGTISDYQGKGGRTHRRTVRDALDVADRVIFVGPHSASVEKMPECGEGRLAAVQTSFEAARVLARESVADELVFIKASSTDHLERIALSFVDEIVCWRERCGKRYGCIRCDRFRSPSAPPLGLDDLADQRQLAVAAPTTGIATIL
jgi:UDP-N-acetylmuramoyl-tripeptide--D-alanyl-D-alanine ligase